MAAQKKPPGPRKNQPTSRFAGSLPISGGVIHGESGKHLRELRDQVKREIQPRDRIEEFWAEDIAHLVWESSRLRRLKNALLDGRLQHGLEKILERLDEPVGPHRTFSSYADFALEWKRDDPETSREVKELLLQAGFTTDTIVAEALVQNIEEVQRLEAMMTNLETRRNIVLRELDRHRLVRAQVRPTSEARSISHK
jgi:hypothetical protein